MKRRSWFVALGRRSWFVALANLLGACAETSSRSSFVERAELGVFYGGQIQERDEIPFEVDPTRQQHGFRLLLASAQTSPLAVRWEIDTPNAGRRTRAARAEREPTRVTRLGRHEIAAGHTRLEQAFVFEPGDPLGVWNFRVLVAEELVIDRSVLVYDPVLRARSRTGSQGE